MTGVAPVVAIDGPNASGKGTIGQALARELGWHLLDSGVLYRLVAFGADRRRIALDDAAGLVGVARGLHVEFVASPPGEPVGIRLEGEDVTTAVRAETRGNDASLVAALPAVRAVLLERQRGFRRPPGLVADGRDMGTAVFPDATLKIFLTASPAVRAERRYKQLRDKGIGVNLAALSIEIAERDRRDRERAAAPLEPAADAIEIDTSALSIEAVLDRVRGLVRARGLGGGEDAG